MKIKKIFTGMLVAASVAVSSFAVAGPINIGGVVFDPDNFFDFTAQGSLFETTVQNIGDTNTGYGIVNQINAVSGFCPHCELTFTFSGFTLVDPTPAHLLFTGGSLKFYVQDTGAPGFTPFDATHGLATAGDGVLWLDLAAHTDKRMAADGTIQTGTLFGSITAGVLGSGTERGNGGGFLDVVGGLAASNLNTNGVKDGLGGFADFNFNSSFTPTLPAAFAAGAFPLTGTSELVGNSVPEPGTMFLVGLGLLGVAAAGKRRKQRNA